MWVRIFDVSDDWRSDNRRSAVVNFRTVKEIIRWLWVNRECTRRGNWSLFNFSLLIFQEKKIVFMLAALQLVVANISNVFSPVSTADLVPLIDENWFQLCPATIFVWLLALAAKGMSAYSTHSCGLPRLSTLIHDSVGLRAALGRLCWGFPLSFHEVVTCFIAIDPLASNSPSYLLCSNKNALSVTAVLGLFTEVLLRTCVLWDVDAVS